MKKGKVIKLNLMLILTIVIFGCSNSNQKHIGEWTGSDNGADISIILNKDNSAVMLSGNFVLGGDSFYTPNGFLGKMEFEIDYTKDPIWLDFVIYREDLEQEKGRLKGIIRFLTNTKMEFRLNMDPFGDRFSKFDIKDENTIVLDKVIE